MSFDQYMQEFYERLDACNDSSPEQREALEAELWGRFGSEKTVLILDMAGFTTKVQKYGLLFFLRKIRYMQKIVAPLLERHNGQLVKFEADNAYAVFQHSMDAVHCALAIHETFQYLANGLPDVDDVVVSIGIARGRILWIPGHDFFGDAVNLASKLGEDLAGHRETYVSQDLFPGIASDPGLKLETMQINISGLTLSAGRISRIFPA
jgi:class 3 adenylate cyclase